jgi:hypothetical protein
MCPLLYCRLKTEALAQIKAGVYQDHELVVESRLIADLAASYALRFHNTL